RSSPPRCSTTPASPPSAGRTSASSAKATCGCPTPTPPRTSSRRSTAWGNSSRAARRRDAMRMLKIPAVALIVVAATPARAQTQYHYECTDGAHFEVAFYPETKAAYLQIDGKSLVLPKRFSLLSQRFKQGGYSFAMRGGGKAIMKHGGK